jgi:hypothetical protein
MNNKPAKCKFPVLTQLCKHIPLHLVKNLAAKYEIDKQARTFSPWSHVVALLFAQISHSVGLNDLCDNLRLQRSKLATLRGATPPSRNGLSHANKSRNSDMMKDLFWATLNHLQSLSPAFGIGSRYVGVPRRFNRTIHSVDSSTIALVANCMPWAKHRRRKAAAKLHLRLNLQTFLPGYAVVEEASHHDDTRAQELCAGLAEGEVVVFDKAYVNFHHLSELTKRGIFWVTRAKNNMAYRVRRKLVRNPEGKILKDELISLKVGRSRKQYKQPLRRVEMKVEVDGKTVVMVFITNNETWAASSVGGLYQSRWGIEVFFKQIKQTLQVCDFLGHSKQAIGWQLWAALLVYILLRYQMFLSHWSHSFTRMLTLIRAAAWERLFLDSLLHCYGTAGGRFRMCGQPQSAYLPGLAPI